MTKKEAERLVIPRCRLQDHKPAIEVESPFDDWLAIVRLISGMAGGYLLAGGVRGRRERRGG